MTEYDDHDMTDHDDHGMTGHDDDRGIMTDR